MTQVVQFDIIIQTTATIIFIKNPRKKKLYLGSV